MDTLRDLFESFYLPGMNTADWWMDYDNDTLELCDSDIFRVAEQCYELDILNNEDMWMGSIRYGLCAFLFDWINLMQEDEVPLPEDAPDEFKDLWNMCQSKDYPGAIPWSMFRNALPYIFYGDTPDDFAAYIDENLSGDGILAYEMIVAFEVTETCITCRFGAGWSDLWLLDHTIKNWKDLSINELADELRACFPAYMYHE